MFPHPTIDKSFIVEQLLKSPKLQGQLTVGKSTCYVIKGTKPLAIRMVVLPESESEQLDYEFCNWIAIRFRFMPELLVWLEENRHWKEGAYITPKKK